MTKELKHSHVLVMKPEGHISASDKVLVSKGHRGATIESRIGIGIALKRY